MLIIKNKKMLKNEITDNEALSIARVSGSTFVNADCFDVFPFIKDKSIDAIICDLPYGTTACKWDTILPFDKLWKEYERIIKPNGVILLFGQEPFSSAMRISNIKDYKFDFIWNKKFASNFAQAKKRPMNIQENICVFYKKQPTYNPNMTKRDKPIKATSGSTFSQVSMVKNFNSIDNKVYDFKYPESIILFPRIFGTSKEKTGHPTQKPLELLEYLVKTYTNEGDMVLDNTMGSGTTNLACIKLNRKSIGIEKEKQYYDVAVRRASEY